MRDTKQILVFDDGVLKYYKGNNPDIIKKALAVEGSCWKRDIVFIKNDELWLGAAIKTIEISAEIPWDTPIFSRHIFEFISKISVDKENKNYTVIGGNLYSKDGKTLVRVFVGKPKNVIIADGTTKCSSFAFDKRKINRLYIPQSIQDKLLLFINSVNCSYIDVDINNPMYTSIDGNLYSKDGKTLVRYAIGKEETEFIVPDGVEKIGRSAFAGASIEKITIPNGVTSIETWAFESCKNLKDVSIPDSINYIGSGAFRDCPNIKYYKENGHKFLGNKLSPKLIFAKPKNKDIESFEVDRDTKIILSGAFDECRDMKSV